MEFNILGPLELSSNGQQHVLKATKKECLLVRLLITPNVSVSTDDLVNWLWDEDPPENAKTTLGSYICKLGMMLRETTGDGVTIVSRRGWRELKVDPEAVDLHRFLRLRRQADSMAASGDFEHATLLLRQADDLWRGPALAGLPGEKMAGCRVSLEEERRAAILRRVGLSLELGHSAELLGELRRLSARYPLDEAFTAHHMTALYRSGRQSESLAVYQEIRNRLVELGTEPGPDLFALHQRILRQDPDLAITPAYRQPGSLPQPNTLPPETGTFIGRGDQILTLTSDDQPAGGPRVKIIEGMAGVGKTTLAVQVARRLAVRYPDAQLYLNYQGHMLGQAPLGAEEALQRLLEMLGTPSARIPRSLDERAALWRTELAHRRAIVILDDVPGPDVIRAALPVTGDCLILVTTRRRLPGMADASPLILDVLPPDDAVRLFTQTAGPENARDPTAVVEVARLCGFLPFAIRLTACRLRQDHPATLPDIIEELSELRGRRIAIGPGGREIMSAFESSYEALSDSQRTFFRRLGLNPCPDFTLHAAMSLGGGSPIEAEGMIASLIDHHLLERAQGQRFHFHDLIRAYAAFLADRDDANSEHRHAVRRLLDYYIYAADRADRVLYPHRRRSAAPVSTSHAATHSIRTRDKALTWLESEWRNILHMVRFADEHEWKRQCVQLAHILAEFLETRGYWDEAIGCHTRALQACRDLDDLLGIVQISLDLSFVNQQRGRYEEAFHHAEEALTISRSLADRGGEAAALDRMGEIHRHSARFRQALAHFQEAMVLYQQISDLKGVADTLDHAGIACWYLGRYTEALDHLSGALQRFRTVGDRRGEAKALNNIGAVQEEQGYHRDALDMYQESLTIFQEIGGRQNIAILHHNIGCIYRYKGDYSPALAEYRRALITYRETGDLRHQSGVLCDIGSAYQYLDNYDEALIHHQKASLIAEEVSDPYLQVISLCGIAAAHCGSGRYNNSLDQYDGALRLAREIEDLYQEARILDGIAEAMLRTQGREMARIYWRQALDIFQQLKVPEAKSVEIRLDFLGISTS
jgi:tetratricopeptide (TPR) repeat protein/DNA-binding SARP family transcriptional activator